jgi:pyruvate/2-oxoglutarate dehydrogenase complex dihydrolipoamide acyltransferase (E2) component
MRTEVILPDLGAASGQPILSVWFVEPGERVYVGDRLAEILLAGATFDVHAPVAGRLAEKFAWPNDRLRFGQVLGLVEPSPELE